MNWDLVVQRGSDFIQKFEFIDELNSPFEFDAETDELLFKITDVKGEAEISDIEIDIAEPTLQISSEDIDEFNMIMEFKLVLVRPDYILTLLSGNIIVED